MRRAGWYYPPGSLLSAAQRCASGVRSRRRRWRFDHVRGLWKWWCVERYHSPKSEVLRALAAVRCGSRRDNTSIQITWRLLTCSGIFTGTPDSSDTWRFPTATPNIQFLLRPCVSAADGCKCRWLNDEEFLAIIPQFTRLDCKYIHLNKKHRPQF